MSKCKQYSDVGYNTYCHLFDSFVVGAYLFKIMPVKFGGILI